MIIGHIPAGYIITTGILRRQVRLHQKQYRLLLLLGLLASILPDFDLLYFYLVDKRQHLHHGYWTHLPVFWVVVFIPLFCYAVATKRRYFSLFLFIVFANVIGHLLLDTIVGKIRWLYPWSDADFVLFYVPVRHGWWVWNFVLHWTFLFELAVVVMAARIL